jgi:hypothetical protein
MAPQFIAYIVIDPPGGAGPDSRSMWRPVGSVWKHKNGNGFDLVVYPGIAVSGRLVVTERRERDKPGEAPADRPEQPA